MNIDESVTQILGNSKKYPLKQHIMDLLEGIGLAHLRCILLNSGTDW